MCVCMCDKYIYLEIYMKTVTPEASWEIIVLASCAHPSIHALLYIHVILYIYIYIYM